MTEEEITALQATNEELVTRVNQLEVINKDLTVQRKELNDKLQDGLTDDEAKAEITNLKALLSGVEDEKTQQTAEFDTKINSMRMRDVLREAGVEAQNSDAMESLSALMLDGVSYDDGFKWANEDGTTRYNEAKKPYGVIDRVNELKEGDKGYLFKPVTGGGGGANVPTSAPQGGLIRTKMSVKEQVDFRATHGEEAYMALPII